MEAVFTHLSESLHKELDFRQEAANMARMREVLAPYPRLAAICAHLEALPAFRSARPEEQPDAETK